MKEIIKHISILPTTCWMITLMVRRGISPHGTLLLARARHSLGGTDCRKCSTAGNSSTGSKLDLLRSSGIFRASFQMHFSTSSATLASVESGNVPFAGNGLTICSSRANRALKAYFQLTRSFKREIPSLTGKSTFSFPWRTIAV
jgi:hypothetical protein